MERYYFSLNNSNAYLNGNMDKVSYTYHVNTFDFVEPHGHGDYWEFTIVTDGALGNVKDGTEHVYEKNSVFYSTTDDEHYLKRRSQKLRYINLIVRESTLKRLADAISTDFWQQLVEAKQKDITVMPSVVDEIEEIIHRVNLLDNSQYQKYNDLLCSAVLLLLQRFLGHFLHELSKQKSTFQSRLIRLMDKKEFLSYNVDDLCANLDYSRMQLLRLFKEHFGVSPHQYLVSYKMQYAANLLTSTDIKVIEVCHLVGYAKLSQFSTNFKQRYGVAPGQFRRQSGGDRAIIKRRHSRWRKPTQKQS